MNNRIEEEEIIKKCGKGNPFRVPEGYFENFTQEMMDLLPEQTEQPLTLKVTLWERVKPLLYLAAMFAGMMLCVRYLVIGEEQNQELPTATFSETFSDQEIETIVNYTMMDDYTLYQYLTDAE